MADENEVPEYLYRGMCISYEELKNFNFSGVDMKLPYEPYIDEQGRKTVHDGNEYGIYMSDNPQMVTYAYGNPTNRGSGVYLEPHISVENRNDLIKIPDIGVCYKISTKGLDVREPWIQNALRGVYNNGYNGKEWISDKIPAENYEVMQVMIGQDMIHNEEFIEIDNTKNLKERTLEVIKQRKARLEIFAQEMSKIPEARRREFGIEDFDVFKEIYGKDGFKYMQNFEEIDTSSDIGMIRYLMAKVYEDNRENIDFKTLQKLQDIKERIKIAQRRGKIVNIKDLIKKHIKGDEKLMDLMDEKESVKSETEETKINVIDFYKKYDISQKDDWNTIKRRLSKESKKYMRRQSTTNDKQELESVNEELDLIDKALEIFNPKNGKREEYDANLKRQVEKEKQVSAEKRRASNELDGKIKIQDTIKNAVTSSSIASGKVKEADKVKYEELQKSKVKGITIDE